MQLIWLPGWRRSKLSNIKVMRRFFGGYQPNPERLQELGYVTASPLRLLSVAASADHGQGRIEGMVRQDGIPYPALKVQVFNRNTKQLIWEATTKSDGRFKFRNIAVDLECYVMVFDPLKEKNAKVKDLIIAR